MRCYNRHKERCEAVFEVGIHISLLTQDFCNFYQCLSAKYVLFTAHWLLFSGEKNNHSSFKHVV